jgi:MFS family permease
MVPIPPISGESPVLKRVGLLIAGTLALWAAAAYPAWWLGGSQGLAYSAVAVILCLTPPALTLLWAEWVNDQSPEQQLTMILGSTVVRMGLVLGVGLLLYLMAPYFQHQSFWVWLLVFYLLTLALEIVIVVSARSATDPRQGPVSSGPRS